MPRFGLKCKNGLEYHLYKLKVTRGAVKNSGHTVKTPNVEPLHFTKRKCHFAINNYAWGGKSDHKNVEHAIFQLSFKSPLVCFYNLFYYMYVVGKTFNKELIFI